LFRPDGRIQIKIQNAKLKITIQKLKIKAKWGKKREKWVELERIFENNL